MKMRVLIIKLFILLPAVVFIFLPVESLRGASYIVQMSNFAYSPATRSIAPGDTVVWTNIVTATSHTSISGTPGVITNGLWASPTVAGHGTFAFTFNGFAAATYPYFCSFHTLQNMTGSITITNITFPAPTVALTNPVAGEKFRAPANIALMASASQVSGTVTNVRFFSGTSALGDVAGSPYNFTVNNAPAGNYSFIAVAANNQGTLATSAVVNVFVLTNAMLTTPIRLIDGQFQFTVLGISNQSYTTEASSNLASWIAINTNVAPANTFNILDPSATNADVRYYRVRQDF